MIHKIHFFLLIPGASRYFPEHLVALTNANQPVVFELTQVDGNLITHYLIYRCIGEENSDACLLQIPILTQPGFSHLSCVWQYLLV